ncbi:hypothetical protein LUX39_28080 [Actinomadura madurae]|nr:hypothetical protein [Actinomadura madurae]MCP9951716.1 hypothetical protein [Actinomadura madurae]MCP9968485.1 hypothetical protein [Actinomadura madurae]MCQ0017153.1 hypothetical protein [Actinomadura madurae]
MTPTTTIGTPDAVFLYSGPDELYREHRPVLDALGGGHTHLGEDIGRAAAYDIALLDIFWTAMAATPTRWPWPVPRASAHASWRRSPRASAPSCRRSSSRPRRTWPAAGSPARATRSRPRRRPWLTSSRRPKPTASTRA